MFRPHWTTASAVALTLGVSLLVACSDQADPHAPAIPQVPEQVVVDLTAGHFSFLTPFGEGTKNGEFNPGLSPVVEICHLATATTPMATTACASVVAWFSTDGGSDASRVIVERG